MGIAGQNHGRTEHKLHADVAPPEVGEMFEHGLLQICRFSGAESGLVSVFAAVQCGCAQSPLAFY